MLRAPLERSTGQCDSGPSAVDRRLGLRGEAVGNGVGFEIPDNGPVDASRVHVQGTLISRGSQHHVD